MESSSHILELIAEFALVVGIQVLFEFLSRQIHTNIWTQAKVDKSIYFSIITDRVIYPLWQDIYLYNICFYLSIYLSTYKWSSYLPISIYPYMPVLLMIFLSIYLAIQLAWFTNRSLLLIFLLSLAFCLAQSLSVRLSVCFSVSLTIYIYISVHLHTSIYLCLCLLVFSLLSLSLTLSLSLSLTLSLSLSVYIYIGLCISIDANMPVGS